HGANAFQFFFFQAEDGIRDGHVTGVQTCALPIFSVALRWYSPPANILPDPCCFSTAACRCNSPPESTRGRNRDFVRRFFAHSHRSEERRVGKECRSQVSKE